MQCSEMQCSAVHYKAVVSMFVNMAAGFGVAVRVPTPTTIISIHGGRELQGCEEKLYL